MAIGNRLAVRRFMRDQVPTMTVAALAVGAVLTMVASWVSMSGLERLRTGPESQLRQSRGALVGSRAGETPDIDEVQIPAGDYNMGSDSGRGDESPQHVVYLDAYFIDRIEVTNAEYRRFVLATDRTAPPYWTANNHPDGQGDYPVVGVSWEDANAYCTWRGKRLPTEAEWEKACRGKDGRVYPWGNLWDSQLANVDVSVQGLRPTGHGEQETSVWDAAWQLLRATPASSGGPGLRPVGSYPGGASPYGAFDMVGNASEWVADWYNWSDYANMPSRNPYSPGPPWNRSIRGSAWQDPAGDASWVMTMSRCSARSSSHADADPRVGFRCARTDPG